MALEIYIDAKVFVEEMKHDPELHGTFKAYGFIEARHLLEIRLTKEDTFSPAQDYWRALVREIRILICTDDQRYNDLRPNLVKIFNNRGARPYLLALATGIATTLGMDAATILPFVSLVLYGATKVGLNAWCAATDDQLIGQLDRIQLEDKS